MPPRVNAPLALAVLALAAPPLACAGSQRAGTGAGSRVEVEWLEPPPDDRPPIGTPAAPGRAVAASPELGDGSAPSEMIAGARRLLGLEVASDAFVRHALAGALVDEAALAPVSHPAAGDLARGGDVVAVVERLDTLGPGVKVVLVGLRDGDRVTRWTTPARGLAFRRAPE